MKKKIYFAGSIHGGRVDAELYNKTKTQLSAMLTGNPYFKIHPYEKEEEIYGVIDEILK